jgi:hypothetical protein
VSLGEASLVVALGYLAVVSLAYGCLNFFDKLLRKQLIKSVLTTEIELNRKGKQTLL